MIIKIDKKDVASLNRMYFHEYYISSFIHLVSESCIIT